MDVCDRIQVLDQGRTLAEGTPGEIRANLDVAAAYLGDTAVRKGGAVVKRREPPGRDSGRLQGCSRGRGSAPADPRPGAKEEQS
jgi:ABC-type multidrug transport system ATPase subunit